MIYFFKQKTAYEMRISDWSSDVCASDLDLQVRADQDQSILRILDEFFKEIVGRTCIEELGHFIPSASLALVSRRIVARTRARPRHAKFGSPRKKSQKWCQGQFGRRGGLPACRTPDRKSTRLNSSH